MQPEGPKWTKIDEQVMPLKSVSTAEDFFPWCSLGIQKL